MSTRPPSRPIDGARRESLDRAARLAVPAGLGAQTWLAVLLAVALLARLDSPSLSALPPLVMAAVLAWPVWRAAPWRPGVTDRAVGWLRANRSALLVGAGLAVLPAVPGLPGALVTLLTLPYRGSGVLFGASLVYRRLLGPTAAGGLLTAWQWSLQALWLYIAGSLLVALGRRLR